MSVFSQLEVWFVVGSQHLYGPQTLKQVASQAQEVVDGLNKEAGLPIKLVMKPLATTPDEILTVCREANYQKSCVGIVTWLHTFSPAKMWIGGLNVLEKPLLQLHTQYRNEIPWDSIDMDFMNLNQTAHGGREFGFIGARMRREFTSVVGSWQDKRVHQKLDRWMRVAAGLYESQNLKVARFGDNMREVAVTEGNKVSAQLAFGYAVNGYGLGDLVSVVDAVSQGDIDALIDEYEATYRLTDVVKVGGAKRANLIDAARIELGIKTFLERGGFGAFTTTFENLYGLKQLPGLSVQRLMQQGYGFGAEGDWKTSALLRIMKVMASGLKGGTSFMEDYTYNFAAGNDLVLGSHMLEVCPSIASEEKPLLDVQHLGIGGKDDPARLIFTAPAGPALNASLIDIGDRFRLLVNTVDTVTAPHALPKLPVASALWKSHPSLDVAVEAWLLAGGAHHTVFTQALDVEHLRIYAEMCGIELLVIDNDTRIPAFKNEIRWNEVYYKLCR
ncbi:L-arabinose isomerase [Leminorella richardii]|uniref:L-arabinose isomerase n=1 Tax=Leminorella richardii TaxID=158841 RepID=A0A2X4V903_9GAMM|nr:L-arabinose isomerase [Leminorella richardii]SQI41790.1 L-arabinose isomerase [Leminorella richardii]